MKKKRVIALLMACTLTMSQMLPVLAEGTAAYDSIQTEATGFEEDGQKELDCSEILQLGDEEIKEQAVAELTVSGEENYPLGYSVRMEQPDETELAEKLEGLEATLGSMKANCILPLEISILNESGEEVLPGNGNLVRLTMDDNGLLDGTTLYLEKQDGTWENIVYTKGTGETGQDDPYIEFMMEEPGTLLFVKEEMAVPEPEETENTADELENDLTLVGGTHGTEMANVIAGQNPDAEILSIRALDDNGVGSTASVVAGIRYAVNSGAKIINLSLYQNVDKSNVLFSEIDNAINKGVIVVGAAGNDNDDVMNYMPEKVADVYTVGAANENGVKVKDSNYGAYVDYNVVADSTSEAAAKFTGYVSANGTDGIKTDNGLIYTPDYAPAFTSETVPDLNLYYICYEYNEEIGDGNYNEHLKTEAFDDILATGGFRFDAEITEEGYLRSYINPTPEYVDFNENGVNPEVGIDRGAMGGIQKNITDECYYNAEEGYIDIPGKYAGLNLTVTVWQSSDSLFYHNLVPDEAKPERHKGQQISPLYAGQDWTQDWTGGVIHEAYDAWGCKRSWNNYMHIVDRMAHQLLLFVKNLDLATCMVKLSQKE